MFRHELPDEYRVLKHNPSSYYQAQVRVEVGDGVIIDNHTLNQYGVVRAIDDETCLVDYGNTLNMYPLWWTYEGHLDRNTKVWLMKKVKPISYTTEIDFDCL